MSNELHTEDHDEEQDQRQDYTALNQELQALRETVASLTQQLQVQLKAQHPDPQPIYSWMQPGDAAWTTPTQLPRDDAAEQADAIARRDVLLARQAETAPPARPPRFLAGNEASWMERDEHGNELTPADIRRRAEERGAEALRRQDELQALRSSWGEETR